MFCSFINSPKTHRYFNIPKQKRRAAKKRSNVTAPIKKPSPLFLLPCEIRNQIWSLVVDTDRPVIVRKRQDPAESTEPPATCSKKHCNRKFEQFIPVPRISVAFTCRQIRLEVTDTYYFKSVFVIESTLDQEQSPRMFLDGIGPDKAVRITLLLLKGLLSSSPADLALFPNLKEVCIEDGNWSWVWEPSDTSSSKLTIFPNFRSLHSMPQNTC